MSVDEASRHHFHEAARATLGDDAAVTLMEMLPPVGWADVATKRDLDQLQEQMRAEIRLSASQLQNRLMVWIVGTGIAVIGATGLFNLT